MISRFQFKTVSGLRLMIYLIKNVYVHLLLDLKPGYQTIYFLVTLFNAVLCSYNNPFPMYTI